MHLENAARSAHSFHFDLSRPVKKRWQRLRQLPSNYWTLAAVTFTSLWFETCMVILFYLCRQGLGDRAFPRCEETKKQNITSDLAHGATHAGSLNFQLLNSFWWTILVSGEYRPKAEGGRSEKEKHRDGKVGNLLNPCQKFTFKHL